MLLTDNKINEFCIHKKFNFKVEPFYLNTNQTIDGYTIVKPLGEGTFGNVYLVKDIDNQYYAMKIMKLHNIPGKKEREYYLLKFFCLEYKIGQISNPYIIDTYYMGIINGNPYIIMKFYKKGSLRKYMGQLSTEEIINYNKQILLGLEALHKEGKIHRDLKPDNVLLDTDHIVLTDFGVAGDRNLRITFTKNIIGSLPYVAPEISTLSKKKSEWLDYIALPTVDIFSFGVVAYELFTGKYPFGEIYKLTDYYTSYLPNIKDKRITEIEYFNPEVPQEWKEVIYKSLEPNREARFQTVEEILNYLEDRSYIPKTKAINITLTVVDGAEVGKRYYLNSILYKKYHRNYGVLTLGRNDPESGIFNDIAIKEIGNPKFYISRRHATLEKDSQNGQWYIRDGQFIAATRQWKTSKNGTFVNSKRIYKSPRFPLHIGDIITIGDSKLKIENNNSIRT